MLGHDHDESGDDGEPLAFFKGCWNALKIEFVLAVVIIAVWWWL